MFSVSSLSFVINLKKKPDPGNQTAEEPLLKVKSDSEISPHKQLVLWPFENNSFQMCNWEFARPLQIFPQRSRWYKKTWKIRDVILK